MTWWIMPYIVSWNFASAFLYCRQRSCPDLMGLNDSRAAVERICTCACFFGDTFWDSLGRLQESLADLSCGQCWNKSLDAWVGHELQAVEIYSANLELRVALHPYSHVECQQAPSRSFDAAVLRTLVEAEQSVESELLR